MTRDNAKEIITLLSVAYPNYHPVDLTLTIDLWAAAFKDYPGDLVKAGVTSFITTDTSGFAPSIGQINKLIKPEPNYLTEAEAETLIRKAISNGYYHAKEEFEKLPELCQALVVDPGNLRNWAQMNSDTVSSVIMSNVRRSYRAEIEKRELRDRTSQELLEAKARTYAIEQTYGGAIEDKSGEE